MRMNRFRFSLRCLFFAVTALVIGFGVSQWRRQRVLREITRLEINGAAMGERDGWPDLVWMRAPEEAGIPIHEVSRTQCEIGSKVYDVRDAVTYAKDIEAELREFGVEEVIYPFIDKQDCITVFSSLDDLPELVGRWAQP
jgi:hypothetical protein